MQMETWLVSQGHTMESVSSLPLDVRLRLATLYDKRLVGPVGEAERHYHLTSILEAILSVLLSLGKGRPMRPKSFAEVFPLAHEMGELGVEETRDPNEAYLAARNKLMGQPDAC